MGVGQKCVCACRKLPNDRGRRVISDQHKVLRDLEPEGFRLRWREGRECNRLRHRPRFSLETNAVVSHSRRMKRMQFLCLGGVAIALLWTANPLCYSADTDHADIKAEITKRHDEAVKRLQDWIGQVSIAAENRGYPEGAEYMAKLARDAGFKTRR